MKPITTSTTSVGEQDYGKWIKNEDKCPICGKVDDGCKVHVIDEWWGLFRTILSAKCSNKPVRQDYV